MVYCLGLRRRGRTRRCVWWHRQSLNKVAMESRSWNTNHFSHCGQSMPWTAVSLWFGGQLPRGRSIKTGAGEIVQHHAQHEHSVHFRPHSTANRQNDRTVWQISGVILTERKVRIFFKDYHTICKLQASSTKP